MSASPSDIITYIGVPLAVLGVLPIIYTCLRALLVLRSIRKALARNGHSDSAITRGSMMSGVVEVELPRCTITPLDRDYDDEYWKLNPNRSLLEGGSWSFFHWNCLITGKKLYRIQYKDELRAPQAEIEFDELIAFLLDRGAVPDENGWKMLRTSGLWTPSGTVLLRSSLSGLGAVLRTGVPDDSDGVLSLKVHWQSGWDTRDKHCLPPFWMRLHQPVESNGSGSSTSTETLKGNGHLPVKEADDTKSDETKPQADDGDNIQNSDSEGDGKNDTKITKNEKSEETTSPLEEDPEEQDSAEAPPDIPLLLTEIEKHRVSLYGNTHTASSVRFRIENGAVEKIYFENDNSLTGKTRSIGHAGDLMNQWFVYAASSLTQSDGAASWACSFPVNILQGVRREAVPCGIMETLGMMTEDETPEWASPRPQLSDPWKQHNRFLEEVRQREIEKAMAPAQAAAARRAREQAKAMQMHNDYRERAKLLQEYEDNRITEALSSPRLTNEAIANACLAWLITNNHLPKEYTLVDLARAVLYLMLLDHSQARIIAELCDRWTVWNQSPGLNRTELPYLQEHKICFCYASSLIYMIQTAAKSDNQVSTDMQECINIWKKVRLG
ncbi:hypothetical protein FQN57_005248 [Myotisia sp. PD_48]|nr:hypothetical protein FQN57_005248 [Myotisia sp. PD_48]